MIEPQDQFRWLEEDPTDIRVKNWLDEQSDRTSAYLSNLPFRNSLRDTLKSLSEFDVQLVPVVRNGRYFYRRRGASEDMPVLYVREGREGEERVLLDPTTLSETRTTVLSDWDPSRDGKYVACVLSKSGNDKAEIRILDVDNGVMLTDHIPEDSYPWIVCWNHDSTGFWYRRRDPQAPENEAKFHRRIFFHQLGEPAEADALVWGTGFKKEWTPIFKLSADGKYLLAGMRGQESGEYWTELYLKKADEPHADFVRVLERVPGADAMPQMHRGVLYVLTDDNASKWKLIATPIADALSENPKFVDILPEREDVLENIKFIGDRLFAGYMHNVYSVIEEYDLDGTLLRAIDLPGLGTAGSFSGEAEGTELFYSYTSFAYPPTIFRYDLTAGLESVFSSVVPTFDVNHITTEQVWCSSKDGTKIPLFLIYKKGLKKDGTNPAMLYGYGGFDISLRPAFAVNPIPFIQSGGIYVTANLRGGGEFGRAWHEAGMKKNKQNVFDDFIAAAEYLIAEDYTASSKLAIQGGSNGGLLVGALMTQRPDLVRAVVCRVPVTDMARFHLHHGGRHWIPDYGDPDNPAMLEYLLSYSPYHNVRDGGSYPATLIMTSDGDDRVHPLHAYKFAARLQEANASTNPILVRVERTAGHSGAQSISRAVEQEADAWSFVFDQLGMQS